MATDSIGHSHRIGASVRVVRVDRAIKVLHRHETYRNNALRRPPTFRQQRKVDVARHWLERRPRHNSPARADQRRVRVTPRPELGRESSAALKTTGFEDISSTCCCHSGAETMLLGPTTDVWLKCALHVMLLRRVRKTSPDPKFAAHVASTAIHGDTDEIEPDKSRAILDSSQTTAHRAPVPPSTRLELDGIHRSRAEARCSE